MPRAAGVYSAPPGTAGSPNTTIESAKYNALVADLVADANAARPVIAGGSGASTAVGAIDNFSTLSADMASAATVNMANATGEMVNITGTVTISSLGTTGAGVQRTLIFAAALTLTNSASLLLPGAADILTAAGDVARFRSKGGGNWICTGFQSAAIGPNSTLKNRNLEDATTAFVDETDGTKKLKFQVAGITTATTRTVSVPDADGQMLLSTKQLLVAGFRNLKVQVTSNTQVTVTADALTVEDATGNSVRLTAVNVTAAITAAGANGLDTGAEAASTFYNVWVAWNGTTAIALLSLSATAPTLPATYTHRARVGAVYNDASANLWRTLQVGARSQIISGVNPINPPKLFTNNAGNPTTPTWVAGSLTGVIPPTAVMVHGIVLGHVQPSGTMILAPNNSFGGYLDRNNPPPISFVNGGGQPASVFSTVQFSFAIESSNLYYASNDSTDVIINGWTDNF